MQAMNEIGVTGITITNVLGCGVQKGAPAYYRGVEMDMNLLPKVKIEIVVSLVPVQKVIETARKKLMDILCNYQGFKKCVLILVFDAYRVPGSPGTIQQYHNIHVVYTKEAETADMFIEHVTHEIGKGRRVRVATSDGMEQIIILGHGALRVSARMFHQEVQEAEKEIRKYLQGEV